MKEYHRLHFDIAQKKGKEYYLKNKDKIIKHVTDWNKKNPDSKKRYYIKFAERIKQKSRDWAKNNKERINARNRKWRRLNPEKAKQFREKFIINNPEKVKMIRRKTKSKRRLILKGNSGAWGIPVSIQKEIFNRDKKCVYCGKNIKLTIDHIVAVYNNGDNSYPNLVLCCNSCNWSKGTKDVFVWCKEQNIKVPDIVIKLKGYEQYETNRI